MVFRIRQVGGMGRQTPPKTKALVREAPEVLRSVATFYACGGIYGVAFCAPNDARASFCEAHRVVRM